MPFPVTSVRGRLLIVDDEGAVRDVLSEYFEAEGYAVATARSGEEALEAIDQACPDVVLLDVRMPGMDGLEVLRRLRSRDGRPAVVMVTANQNVELARDALKIGAVDYVAKPFDFGYLDQAVAAAMVHAADAAPAGADSRSAGREDPWRRLTLEVFRATRAMEGTRSIASRLEETVLEATRHSAAGRAVQASERLGELELLLAVGAELSDLPGAARSTLEAALAAARESLVRG